MNFKLTSMSLNLNVYTESGFLNDWILMAYILPRVAALDVPTASDSLNFWCTLHICIAALSGLPLKYRRALFLLRFTETLLHLSLPHPRCLFPWGHWAKHFIRYHLFGVCSLSRIFWSFSTHITHHNIRSSRQTAHIAYFVLFAVFFLYFLALGCNIF
jgi:hypothetical protein